MILYEYKNENGKWSRSKVKDLTPGTPGTPEFKFYEKNNFIEEKWFKEQEFLNKYPEDSIIYKSALKKIKILEEEYSWLGNFDEKPKYNIEDTIEDLKRMNAVLVNFLEEMVQWHNKSDKEIRDSIMHVLDNIHIDNDTDDTYKVMAV